jgi:hypothetical protein
MYPVSSDPLLDGGFQLTVTLVTPAIAIGRSGVPGTPKGVMDELAADHGPCPAALIAATRKRTDVPLFSPVAVQVSTAPRPVHPGCEVKAPPNRDRCTAYPVMADPPLDGAVQVSIEFVSPAVALGAFGAPGTPEGVAAADDPDAAPVPAAFTAATRK